MGGVAGFHSGGYQIKGCTCSDCTIKTGKVLTSGIGALMGNIGNAAHTTGAGCAVNCTIDAFEGSTEVGMIVGHFNGNTKVITLGTEDSKIKVKGTVKIGGTSTVLDSGNYSSYLWGLGNYSSSYHTFYTEYGE